MTDDEMADHGLTEVLKGVERLHPGIIARLAEEHPEEWAGIEDDLKHDPHRPPRFSAEVNGRGFVRWLDPTDPATNPSGRGGGPRPTGGGEGVGIVAQVVEYVMQGGDGDPLTFSRVREGLGARNNTKRRDLIRAALRTAVSEGRLRECKVTVRGIDRADRLRSPSKSHRFMGPDPRNPRTRDR